LQIPRKYQLAFEIRCSTCAKGRVERMDVADRNLRPDVPQYRRRGDNPRAHPASKTSAANPSPLNLIGIPGLAFRHFFRRLALIAGLNSKPCRPARVLAGIKDAARRKAVPCGPP
jgi:hypothetical protein